MPNFETDHDVRNKVDSFQALTGTIRKNLQEKTQTQYKVTAFSAQLYSSETQMLPRRDSRIAATAEMRLLRGVIHLPGKTVGNRLQEINYTRVR